MTSTNHMKFQNNNIKLAIFDLDGTLLDSTSLWSDIDKEFFFRRNLPIPKDYTKEIAHIGLIKASILTHKKYLPHEKPEDIYREWMEMSLKAYAEDIQLKPGVIEALELLKSQNIDMCVVTANSEELYDPCLKRLGIYGYFSKIIPTKEFKNGKSTSEIYDHVRGNNIKPNETLVFEDLLAPLKVTYEAGYITIGVNDNKTVPHPEENKKYSHLFIDDFHEFVKSIK